jgi:hypothetical protein
MTNEILKFGEDATNILTQAEYDADAQRLIGNQPGIARSKLVNKVLRQCAFISNGFAEYLIDRVGGDVLDDDDSAALLAKIQSAFTFDYVNDNYAINGNFDFWQVNTSVSVTVNNTYTADMFVGQMAGSTATVARQTAALTEPFNASYFLRAAVTSSVGIANFNRLQHRMEAVSRLADKEVTISFYAKADSSRNMSIELEQHFGAGGSPSANVDSIGVEKVALTTSWQKFTKTVTLPSISGKVLGTTQNSSYLAMNFWFDAGANYDSRTDSLGQQSGTFDIAQLKIELGAVDSNFVLAGKTLEGELALVQRYYEKSYNIDTAIATATTVGATCMQNAYSVSALNVLHVVRYKVTKRILPTWTSYNPVTGASGTGRSSAGADVSVELNSTVMFNAGEGSIPISMLLPSAGSGGFQWVADARL